MGVSSLKLAIFWSFIWLLRAKYRMEIFFGVRILWIILLFRFLIIFWRWGGVNSRYRGQAYVAIQIGPPGISAILINWTSQNLRIVGRYFTFLFKFFWTLRNIAKPDQTPKTCFCSVCPCSIKRTLSSCVNMLPHRDAFNTSCKFAYGNMIRYDPTLVDLTSNLFVLCTDVKVHLYNYS